MRRSQVRRLHSHDEAHAILTATVPLVGQDTQSHLMGTHMFVRAQEYHELSGMRQAAFRVVLRQEIVVAFRSQKPVQLLREYVEVDRAMNGQDDWTLAFHAIVLCAEILNYCYGEQPRTVEEWDEYERRARDWMASRSASFKPLHRIQPRSSVHQVFPEIWLLNDCHGMSSSQEKRKRVFSQSHPIVAAYQHYLICQVLLVAHNPRTPQLGPGRIEAASVNEVSTLKVTARFNADGPQRIIKRHVEEICGIALANTHCIPSMFTASLVIATCIFRPNTKVEG